MYEAAFFYLPVCVDSKTQQRFKHHSCFSAQRERQRESDDPTAKICTFTSCFFNNWEEFELKTHPKGPGPCTPDLIPAQGQAGSEVKVLNQQVMAGKAEEDFGYLQTKSQDSMGEFTQMWNPSAQV